jgi:hypothetical protein
MQPAMTSDNQTTWYLAYPLRGGFVHNWVAAGPQVIAVADLAAIMQRPIATEISAAIAAQIAGAPRERAKFTLTGPDGSRSELTWRYLSCAADHLVDLADVFPPRRTLIAWAYTELTSPKPQAVRLALATFGPAQVWVNDDLVLAQTDSAADLPRPFGAEVHLASGANAVLVRLAQVTAGPTPCGFRLHLAAAPSSRIKVRVPTLNRATDVHQSVERVAERAFVEADLYAGQDALHVKWPKSLRGGRGLMIRVQKPSGAIVGEVQPAVTAGLSQHVLEANWVKDGRYTIKVLPDFESFVRGLRVSHDLDVSLLHSDYVTEPDGDINMRAVELLKHAAWWTDGLYAQIASMALGLWKQVNAPVIARAIDAVLAQADDCDRTLLGLLLIAYRYAADAAFPAGLAPRLEECLLRFPYSSTDPMQTERGPDDDRAIVGHACRVLAGQLYPDRHFESESRPGSWQQERGEQSALAWLARRATGGFAAWDSGEGFAAMLLGLVALVDHAANDTLSDLAAATVDKVLFTLAANSFRGVFGSTHGATSAASITDARMEPMSPITRLLWGVGCWNQHMAAGIALATSRQYGCPPLLQHIALDAADAVWVRERHVTLWRGSDAAGPEPAQEVDKVTYRTPGYMLASAQDYRPGETGRGEHIWQATLGPSAVVFVNHPQVINQKDAYRANFWRGNGSLPRVAQWRDLLIAHYRLPADDWLGYTHAHFPVAAFDETALRRGWAFGRKGDGYIALAAAAGIELIKTGPGAYRELRSSAPANTWLCQMGSAGQDSSFAAFQRAILERPVSFDDHGVAWVSPRGETVAFSWTGPLLVQGEAQPLHGFAHHESSYCICPWGATGMDIRYADWTLRLDLEPVAV